MGIASPFPTPSMVSKKEIWARWDEVWEHRIASEARLLRLISVTTPDFIYQSPQHNIHGNLDAVVQAVDDLLHEDWDDYKITRVEWYEHHDQSAARWKVVSKTTGAEVSKGWSHARYSADGKLASVTEFYDMSSTFQEDSQHRKTKSSARWF